MTTKRKNGRRTKLTEELIEQVRKTLALHNSNKTACELVGISEDCFYRWIREAEDGKRGLTRKFYEAVKSAKGQSKVILMNSIAKDPAWQAKAWILERLHPKEFGRRVLNAHEGADGKPTDPGAGGNVTVNLHMAAEDTDEPWADVEKADQAKKAKAQSRRTPQAPPRQPPRIRWRLKSGSICTASRAGPCGVPRKRSSMGGPPGAGRAT